jgi:hypothetical protein
VEHRADIPADALDALDRAVLLNDGAASGVVTSDDAANGCKFHEHIS